MHSYVHGAVENSNGANFCKIKAYLLSTYPFKYVTGFGKTCVVHTPNLTDLEIHKNYREWYTDMKLSGMKKE